MSGSQPRPYVPRFAVRRDVAWPDWPEDHIDSRGRSRLYHSCYKCGHHEEDLAVLDAHEDRCTKAARTEET